MSHNLNKLLNASPNVQSSFSLGVSDFTDITSNLTDGQTIAYNTTNNTWESVPVPVVTPPYCVAVGKSNTTSTDDYVNCGYTITKGNPFCFYDPAPVNNISSLVTLNYVSGTDWIESFTLQPGKYELSCQAGLLFSSSGKFAMSWQDTSGNRYSNSGINGFWIAQGPTSYVKGAIETASAITLSVIIDEATNVSSTQGIWPSSRSYLSIRQLA